MTLQTIRLFNTANKRMMSLVVGSVPRVGENLWIDFLKYKVIQVDYGIIGSKIYSTALSVSPEVYPVNNPLNKESYLFNVIDEENLFNVFKININGKEFEARITKPERYHLSIQTKTKEEKDFLQSEKSFSIEIEGGVLEFFPNKIAKDHFVLSTKVEP